jgi:hypothetical protein
LKRFIPAALAACALAALLAGPSAASASVSSPVASGFYDGHTIKYLDFGPIHLAKGNKVAPIWSVANPVAGQHNIVDVVPGKVGYTPLWRVTLVTFKKGVHRVLIRSAAQVRRLARDGKVTLKRTNTVVNCPVLGFGQPKVTGYYKGRTISYLDLGPVKLAAGNKVAPLWTVTNGTTEQHNVVDVVPGDTGYSPLWDINKVTWNAGVTPRTLTSLADIEAARAAGEVTVSSAHTIVNCPVV